MILGEVGECVDDLFCDVVGAASCVGVDVGPVQPALDVICGLAEHVGDHIEGEGAGQGEAPV